ncbi:hypothetical protein HUG15_19830 [Salicibibacter cibarius]|uniref:Uncharacterized protein n=1 Tax=Salicibibacter cibarius TaxID=2743000 RepID=A0A7T6Z643_9BACI|nr:hypothetical protein [Salicibibacter cibarius]QQK77611.1 hypothetical protein HUG15_19830 [Salicibibacter cibarius]
MNKHLKPIVNAIEGNTLTIYETKAILEDGITIGKGKMLREHMEAINHRDAIVCRECNRRAIDRAPYS